MKMLKVIDIKKIYGKGENEIKAVDGITLEIEPHKFSAIIGQSGSGKSTLLHCMAGLDKPTLGNVFMDNLDLYTLSDEKLSNLRSKEFGFIFQNYNLIPVINVYDNIVLPILIAKGKIDNNYINDLITKLGLESQINKFPNELSGGQQQRVAIARSLANKPSIIFADEPTGNLDSKTTNEVMNLLKYCVNEYKQTLVMITHNDEIAKMADCIITISDGKVI
ncbi:TPA: ABC transporter ATP-binding protein [Clostridioides difficile]|uniref:ABC transporter ATP-binding protein n=2 Tax=Clostridioides difficile TaxID=1496 RepID=A0AB74QG61_CLODI|nr:ABC transporter ATP-binding protein [Clostridioides difficile]EQG74464.1 ABC transporter family protein [Clostridioides difficile DA00165]OFU06916.1 ABC transporter ATP-binding protein [Clostridium sp. HMSC19D02]OFU08330.1 ABC transporter ATP-binding protein [Clostridium sp. HMSC19D07]OFU11008.1 ABC transporter ATP-binding protein [Clostridium sp. HMSC19C11]OFU30136.1 ABC transporter ATP-binding protein [Clostridium sp. HMSC19B11]OFU33922.1 ABC transporter ATP-binding protein [Clostridium 